MGCGAAAAIAGVAAVGSIASGVISGGAAGDAAQAQINAINNEPKLDIPSVQKDAQAADQSRFEGSLALQAKDDPNSAALRTNGATGILSQLSQNASGNSAADQALSGLQTQAANENAVSGPMISQLVQQAQNELNAGATLPPEFQAELVRSGLEGASTAGNSLNGDGSAGANLRTLLGSAGINLQAQRQGQALSALGGAQSLEQQRSQILNGIATLGQQIGGQNFSQAEQANQIGTNNVPQDGLTGSDVASLNVAKNNQADAAATQIGQLQGQQALANGQILSSMVSGGTKLLTGGLGALSNSFAGSGNSSGVGTGQLASLTGGNGPVSNSYSANTNNQIQGINAGSYFNLR